MVGRAVWIVAAIASFAVAACAGPVGGVSEGDSCNGDDCAQDLTCQPIMGRQGDFCCPTPATMSSKPNCQPAPAQADGG
jgi:hypothetical protein